MRPLCLIRSISNTQKLREGNLNMSLLFLLNYPLINISTTCILLYSGITMTSQFQCVRYRLEHIQREGTGFLECIERNKLVHRCIIVAFMKWCTISLTYTSFSRLLVSCRNSVR